MIVECMSYNCRINGVRNLGWRLSRKYQHEVSFAVACVDQICLKCRYRGFIFILQLSFPCIFRIVTIYIDAGLLAFRCRTAG